MHTRPLNIRALGGADLKFHGLLKGARLFMDSTTGLVSVQLAILNVLLLLGF